MKLLLALTAATAATAPVLSSDLPSCRKWGSESKITLDSHAALGSTPRHPTTVTVDDSNHLVANNGTQLFRFYKCDPPSDDYAPSNNKLVYGVVKTAGNPDLCLTIQSEKGLQDPKNGVLTMEKCRSKNDPELSRQWFLGNTALLSFMGTDYAFTESAVTGTPYKNAVALTDATAGNHDEQFLFSDFYL